VSIREVPELIAQLYKITQRLEEIFPGRPFTPDGHLVGSIGEVVAKYIYELELKDPSCAQFDAETKDGRSVQIKLTGPGGKGYGFRWSNQTPCEPPDLLLALKLTTSGFVEVFNGHFPIDLLKNRKDSTNGQLTISVSKLSSRNEPVIPQVNSLAEFNMLFVAEAANG